MAGEVAAEQGDKDRADANDFLGVAHEVSSASDAGQLRPRAFRVPVSRALVATMSPSRRGSGVPLGPVRRHSSVLLWC